MPPQVIVYDPTLTDEQSRLRGVGRYLQILKENFPDWTFTNDVLGIEKEAIFINPFFNPLFSPLITKKITKWQIIVIHDLIPLKYPAHFPAGLKGRFNVLANKKILPLYDLVITDSEVSKVDIKARLKIPETNIKVIYPCLPKIFTTAQKKKTLSNYQLPNTKYFIYVGDATWNKNLVNLAKAIKLADITCYFVGGVFGQMNQLNKIENAWQKELFEFFTMAKGDPRFVFPGFVADHELVNLYKNAQANILVSKDEGFGFSFIEASSQEVPSLLSDIAVLHEISQDAALFVDEKRPEEIAVKIKALLENEDLRQTLGQEAKERSRFFASAQFKNALDKLIKSIL